ncbi:TRAP transporter large permease [Bordetella tumulicola]|uniref:TRAP transporter large permease n=1 Tax=Bordetella tumulicola TaxID=1649133 RepID=UPI0039F02681
MTAILVLVFAATLVAGVPVAMSMGGAGLAALLWGGTTSPMLVAQRLFSGLDSFPMMAIPFFILAAELMTGGRLTDLLVKFACQLIGNVRGGLGYANVGMAIFMAGLSGSALADAAGPGSVVIRMMRQAGYPLSYAAGLTAAGAIIAPIIPPSIIMVIYALTDNSVSVMGLFMAGIVPGIMLGASLLILNWWIAKRENFTFPLPRPSWGIFLLSSWKVLPAALMPIIILGGIHGGLFTPTEAAAVAAVYAFIVGRFIIGTLTVKQIPRILVTTALMSSVVLLVISMATVFAYMLTVLQIPQSVSQAIVGLGLPPLGLLIAVSLFLLACGLFLDTLPAVIILVPILAPVAQAAGIDPLHFAMVVILNLTIGMITPPVGGVLFVVSVITKLPLFTLARAIMPMLIVELIVFALIVLFPGLSTWLPNLAGYTH